MIVTRRVAVRYSYDIEIDVPYHWTGHDIEFHRNDSSWCADNAQGDIDKFVQQQDGWICPCSCMTATYIGEADGTPRGDRP